MAALDEQTTTASDGPDAARSARGRLVRVARRASVVLGIATLALVGSMSGPEAQEAPRHRGIKADTKCSACHTTSSWTKVKPKVDIDFAHPSTGFPLFGAHRGVTCDRCHNGRGLAREGATCQSCHKDVHRGENGARCEQCHTERSFAVTDATRKHRMTRFPLIGAHAVADCNACHLLRNKNRYRGTPTQCYACHAEAYAKSQNPPHAQSGFPTTCEQCHLPRAWLAKSNFHDRFFKLRGEHRSLACNACHQNNVFKGTPASCAACHGQDFAATTNPPHAAAGFSQQCQDCHTENGWVPAARFQHSSAFPLTGAHRSAGCVSCHANNLFRGAPRDCYTCHQQKYAQTTAPAHAAAGFPTACDTCHTATAWTPATFDHNQTFRLQGAHATQACAACHGNGVYRGTPRDCYTCHQAKYAQTTNPNHQAAGFPTTCDSCHSQNAWQPASFNHDPWFPITSGKHARPSISCQSCHTSSSNYQIFSCITCHEHRQSSMDSEHRNRSGYVYDSNACYRCHPRGRT